MVSLSGDHPGPAECIAALQRKIIDRNGQVKDLAQAIGQILECIRADVGPEGHRECRRTGERAIRESGYA